MFSHLILNLDRRRVQRHLRSVEQFLRQHPNPMLSPALQEARSRQLDHLREYWQTGVFPQNLAHPVHVPCFIDDQGQRCAVAHLMMESGAGTTAHYIARHANYARIKAMPFPQLENWVGESGLSKAEVALIQPTYCPPMSVPLEIGVGVWVLMVASILILVGMPLSVYNWVLVVRHWWLQKTLEGRSLRYGWWLGRLLGLVAGVLVILLLTGHSLMMKYTMVGSYGWNTATCEEAAEKLLATGEGGMVIRSNFSWFEPSLFLLLGILFCLPYFLYRWRSWTKALTREKQV